MYDTLISATDLARNLSRSDWRLLDCRASLTDPAAGLRAFRNGHLPGALHADLEQDLAGPPGPGNGGRHPLPAREILAATFRRWGIDNHSQLICYDDAGGGLAARLWWLARWLGLPCVALLDGGIQAWLAADLDNERLGDQVLHSAVTAARSSSRLVCGEPPLPESGNFTPRQSLTRQTTASDILSLLCLEVSPKITSGGSAGTRRACLLDARSQSRFTGEVEPIDPLAGHIPGAVCLPFRGNLNDNGRFKPSSELARRFAAVTEDKAQVICYCGSGVTAAHNILAMKVAGYPEPLLYPGSWSEWIEDEQRPVVPARKT